MRQPSLLPGGATRATASGRRSLLTIGALAVALAVLVAHRTDATLIPSADGLTVYDTILHVTWLANANLAGASAGHFSISTITPGGAMDYATALQWVAALNAANGGAGYLGHNTWQLPASVLIDAACNAVGPNNVSFGFGCALSAMPSLFYQSLGFHYPNTAVPMPDNTTGPFHDFQPYLYWSATAAADSKQGYHTFSFATGWHGSNVDNHYMYVLPMIAGRLPAAPPPTGNGLQPSADGRTVYDPVANVTWLADANLAKSQTFNAQCTGKDGVLCINPGGSMSHTTALNWINAMNAANYLGQSSWQLPPIPDKDPSCQNGGFGCTGDPLGALFYNQLHLAVGTPAVPTPPVKVGPFQNLQPYLYWTCQAAAGSQVLCGSDLPAPGFGWSFSFGNGFQGTDLQTNGLYVMVYYPGPTNGPRRRAVHH
jgi:hypothetical protein